MNRGHENAYFSSNPEAEFWFAIQVVPQHERKVAALLKYKEYRHFLPLHEVRHRWSDRIKRIEEPLFPGYVFFRSKLASMRNLQGVPGVIRIVSFGGKPCPVPEEEVEALRQIVDSRREVCSAPYLAVGDKVQVIAGPLLGITGIITQVKKHYRLVVSVDLLMKSVSVSIDGSEVELSGRQIA